MFLSVRDLEQRKIPFQTAFAPGQIDFFDDRMRQKGPLEARGTAELVVSLGEIRVAGHLRGEFACDCDRCLEPVRIPVDCDFDLVYRPADLEGGVETEISSDDAVGFYEGDGIELSDVVREQVLLELPMQRVCSPGCRGICPACGQNRNLKQCDCRTAPVDERWAGLQNLPGD